MLSKNQLKYIHSLKQKKFREQYRLFIAEGPKIVDDLWKSGITFKQLYANRVWIEKNNSLYEKKDVVEITNEELNKISLLTEPNEVFAIAEMPDHYLNEESLTSELTIILDDIRDPGNLGTIIRIADWFGISTIICSENSVDAFNPKVVQATMGSIARIKVVYQNLSELFEKMKGKIPIYGALLQGENIYGKKLNKNGFIIIGNESKGISKELLPYITDKISIPSFAKHAPFGINKESVESLNAAMATAIICSEFRRTSL